MAQNLIKAHGLRIVNNGWLENASLERLTVDPTIINSGRIWYNETEKKFKGSFKNESDEFVIYTFSTNESLQEFINLLKSENGTDHVGYAGYTSTSGTISLSAGSLTNTVNDIVEKLADIEQFGCDGVGVNDEGITVLQVTKNLNFIGDNILAVQSGQSEVTVYVPAPTFAPFYNSDDALIPDFAAFQRKISNNTGASFKIGNWTPGTSQKSSKTSTWTFNTPVQVGFNDKLTNFKVKVLGDDDLTVLSENSILKISDNVISTQNGITITISDWTQDYFRYKAKISVSINLTEIIPNGGRFSVQLIHENSTLGTFTKNQGPIFFDPHTTESKPSISSVSIIEKTPVLKALSGIKYYTTNSTFDISVNEINNINKITWPNDNNVVKINSNNEYGIPDHNLQASAIDITGWTNEWNINNLNSTLTKTITRTGFRFIGTDANISCFWIDWENGNIINSENKSILIDTFETQSDNQNEEFTDENKRLNSDLSTPWKSNNILESTDLMVQDGKLQRQSGNWTTYLPINIADYSLANTQNQVYFREFNDSGISHSNGIFNITGITETELTTGKVKIEISTNKTDWFDCSKDYTSGVLSNGSGCRINKDTRQLPQLEFTLGTGGSTDATTGLNGFGIFVKITMPNMSTSKIDYFRITNW